MKGLNPVTLSGELGTENPVVTRLRSGADVAVFDTILGGVCLIGYSVSRDGITGPLRSR